MMSKILLCLWFMLLALSVFGEADFARSDLSESQQHPEHVDEAAELTIKALVLTDRILNYLSWCFLTPFQRFCDVFMSIASSWFEMNLSIAEWIWNGAWRAFTTVSAWSFRTVFISIYAGVLYVIFYLWTTTVALAYNFVPWLTTLFTLLALCAASIFIYQFYTATPRRDQLQRDPRHAARVRAFQTSQQQQQQQQQQQRVGRSATNQGTDGDDGATRTVPPTINSTRRNDSEDSVGLCTICKVTQADTVCLPCWHQCMCAACANMLMNIEVEPQRNRHEYQSQHQRQQQQRQREATGGKRCPICRAYLDEVKQVFLS